MLMHISSLLLSRGASYLLKWYMPWATKVQFPFSLSEVCQRGTVLYIAEQACTVFHIFLPFHRKITHSKCFLLTQDSESKLDGIKRDKSVNTHYWSLKNLIQTILSFFFYFLLIMQAADTTQMSTVWMLILIGFPQSILSKILICSNYMCIR